MIATLSELDDSLYFLIRFLYLCIGLSCVDRLAVVACFITAACLIHVYMYFLFQDQEIDVKV